MSKGEQRIAIEIRGLMKVLKYFGLVFLTGWICSYFATRFVNLDMLILQFHLQNLWLVIPEGTVVFGFLAIWNWSRTSEKKKRQRQAQEQIDKLLVEAKG